jgi:flagellar hook-associated protein 1 FlgK
MSDFVSFYTALSGLRAAQAGLTVTADNIANAGTPGRTRQRVELSTNPPHHLAWGDVGSGVHIDGVSRARSAFLDLNVREGTGALGRLDARAGVLARLESLFVEPTAGITDGLSVVWGAFEDLANDPNDGATRTAVIGSLENLVTRIRAAAESIDTVVGQTRMEMVSAVDEVNRLTLQVADLNRQIFAAGVDETTPNDLLDRRDVVLDRLAELAAIRVTPLGNNMVRLSSGGIALVEGEMAISLSLDSDGITVRTPGGSPIEPGGVIGGLQRVLGDDVPAHRGALDGFAADLADALNSVHAAGFTPGGAAGGALLAYDPARAAVTLEVVIADPTDVAAAGDPSAAPFDAGNAEALGALRFAQVAAGGTMTLDEQYRNIVAGLGAATASARAAADSQGSLVAAADAQRTNATGVSIDEEMVMLMTYQRSYEAAARVMTVIDETLELLVNRLGLVGR